jgi:hypothetical protein
MEEGKLHQGIVNLVPCIIEEFFLRGEDLAEHREETC